MRIRAGETHVLFGPNGSGKSSLLMAIMGWSRYRVTKGRILFQGQDVTHLPVDERARLGIGLMQQRPSSVRGIPLGQLAEVSTQGKNGKRVAELAEQLDCSSLLARDVNLGFSGGEMKKAELLQLMAQQPALALVDEPDAGVDLDSIAVMGQALACLVKQPSVDAVAPAALTITHTGHILNYPRADVGHVLYDGRHHVGAKRVGPSICQPEWSWLCLERESRRLTGPPFIAYPSRTPGTRYSIRQKGEKSPAACHDSARTHHETTEEFVCDS